jgi:hypothetical protein
MVPPGEIWCYLRNRVSKNTPSRQPVNSEVAAGLFFVPPGKEGGDETIDDENLQLVIPAEVSKVRLLAGMVPSESSSASTMRSLRRWAQSPSR